MGMWSLFTLVFTLVGVCNAHTLHFGRTCPNVQAYPNLSVSKILGLWYVVYQLDTSNTCMVWNLTKSDENFEQLLLKESRQIYVLDALKIDHKHSQTAVVNIPNPEVPARMRIRWPTSLTGEADFTIFDTDYENYLAVFQCDRALVAHRRDIAILSRTSEVDEMFVKRVRRLMDTAEVRHSALEEISHHNCRKSSSRNWHHEGAYYGLLPAKKKSSLKKNLSHGIDDYDISEIEIIGEGIDEMTESFRGSLKKPII